MSEAGITAMSQVAVGTAGIGIAVALAKPSNGDPSEICLHPSCMAVPDGWVRDSSGLPSPTAATTPSTVYCGAGTSICDISLESLTKQVSDANHYSSFVFDGCDTSLGIRCRYHGTAPWGVEYSSFSVVVSGTACPTGYSASGSVCSLTNASGGS
jgi:hypothetical protein